MTLLETAIEKWERAIGRKLTEIEAKHFEAGWIACLAEHRRAEEEAESE